jgi:hypothetical protein
MHQQNREIRVAVVFGPGMKLTPVWFDLNRRKHVIREITTSWLERRGDIPLLHFRVTDDGALYELVYDMKAGTWKLTMMEPL